MQVDFFTSLSDLSPEILSFLEEATGADFFAGAPWWRTVFEAGLSEEDAPLLAAASSAGGIDAVLPLRIVAGRRLGIGMRTVRSLTTPYSISFGPSVRPGADVEGAARALGRAVGALRIEAAHFDALDDRSSWLQPFRRELRNAGYLAHDYRHFANWYEPVAGRTGSAYLADRDGALREILRRKGRRLARQGRLAFELVSGGAHLEEHVAEYERIYALSWKEPEPFPDFHATLIRAAAQAGCLRLGFCRLDDENVAVQLWTIAGGRATVLKLAHAESARHFSVGSLLTAHMITHMIDVEGAAEIDFGRGDDGYKRHWASHRRERTGFVAARPGTLAGLVETALTIAPGRLRNLLRGAPDREDAPSDSRQRRREG